MNYGAYSEVPQEADRITQILQSRAPAPSNVPMPLPASMPQPIPPQEQMRVTDILKQKIASGDPQATALDKRVKLFVGDDPTAYDSAVQFLSDHPDEIDPTNSYQTSTALAQWSRQSGYHKQATAPQQAPREMPTNQQFAMQDLANIASGKGTDILGLQQDAEKNIATMNALDAKAIGGGSGSGGVTQFVYNKTKAALEAAGVQVTPEMEMQIISASRNGLLKGSTITVNGKQIEIANILGQTDTIAAQEMAKQDASNQSDLNYKPSIAGGEQEARNRADVNKTNLVKERSAKDNLSLIDEILAKDETGRTILDKATGSGVGAIYAGGKQFFGKSDESTQANSALNVYGGRLLNNVPRMEGPQSDKDVATYREQAGKIADPTIPAADKKSALNIIRDLSEKYADGPASSAPPANNITPQGAIPTGKTIGGKPVYQLPNGKGWVAD